MCGIVGIISFEPVIERLVIGTDRLQNRGEHSTGVSTYDGKFFYDHGDLGSPDWVFHNYDLSQLKGNIGITHTRYATTGSTTRDMLRRNIQPVTSDRPGMRTCANGDLINLVSQRERLRAKGFSFQSEVDAKVIQNTMIDHFISQGLHSATNIDEYTRILFESLKGVHKDLNGAYSVLTILERGLLVFKDPYGIRPLCMATRQAGGDFFTNKEYAFASESSVFNYFGDYDHIEEIKPCEAVFIDRETLQIYRTCLSESKSSFCFFEFVYFARPDSKFRGRVVESARKDLGKILAKEYSYMKSKLDTIIGVPSTGLSSAHSMAQELDIPYDNAIIKIGNKRSFQEPSPLEREKAIDEKFIFIKDFIEGKRIGIVDDSNVRGTTARKIVQRLFNLGAKEVHLFYFSPKIIGPCFYGIDTPDESMLIAWNRSSEQICQFVGATSVNYISKEGLIQGLKLSEDELCLACITRNYPTPIDEISSRLKLRQTERTLSKK